MMPSIPTEALLDVNVLIATVFADHVMHLPARRFVESLKRFYTSPIVQGGFLRFATRPLKNERGELPFVVWSQVNLIPHRPGNG